MKTFQFQSIDPTARENKDTPSLEPEVVAQML